MKRPSQQGAPPAAREAFFLARFPDALVKRLAHGRIYYGWYIVSVVFAIEITTVGFNGPFFSLFLKPMSQEFGWTRTMTTGAVTIGTVVAAVISFGVGWILDRYGPRWMLAAGCLVLGAAYLGLSQVNSLLVFYLIYAVGRSVFQSALGRNMLNALTSKWFVRRRAMAIAFSTLGGVLGGTIMSPVTQGIIDGYGWRQAWVLFGIMALSVALLPWLLLRRLPEDIGLLPDGDGRSQTGQPSKDTSHAQTKRRPTEFNLTLGQAAHTISFWVLCVMMGVTLMATTGVTFNMSPHFTDVGVSKAAAAAAISVFTVFQAPSVFLWGFVADRLGAKQALLGVLLNLAVGTWLISRAHSPMEAYLGSAVFGAGMGGIMLAIDVVWADFFGRKHLGNIRGASMAFQMVGNASGSIIAAMLYDWKGSYDDAFKAIIAALLLSSAILMLARKPRPKTEATP